eukprot:747877-Hanusia_phi.AAC.4
MHVHEHNTQDFSIASEEIPEVEFDLTSEPYSIVAPGGNFRCAACQFDSDCCVMNGGDHLRYKKFGCPCKFKQLTALAHSISLISSKKARQIIGATGSLIDLRSQ